MLFTDNRHINYQVGYIALIKMFLIKWPLSFIYTLLFVVLETVLRVGVVNRVPTTTTAAIYLQNRCGNGESGQLL